MHACYFLYMDWALGFSVYTHACVQTKKMKTHACQENKVFESLYAFVCQRFFCMPKDALGVPKMLFMHAFYCLYMQKYIENAYT